MKADSQEVRESMYQFESLCFQKRNDAEYIAHTNITPKLALNIFLNTNYWHNNFKLLRVSQIYAYPLLQIRDTSGKDLFVAIVPYVNETYQADGFLYREKHKINLLLLSASLDRIAKAHNAKSMLIHFDFFTEKYKEDNGLMDAVNSITCSFGNLYYRNFPA